MKAEIKLESCPFCGNDNRDEFAVSIEHRSLARTDKIWTVYNVGCSCGATGPDGNTRKEAVKRWNRRAEGV
ncbi:MAG: Lar family restriction alleviation protein [Treponema sp.]|nr:Lar family restriction alleviation protein [Treponema sp.]